MAFNFPASPSNGDTYTANGFTYEWDGSKWIRKSPSAGAQGAQGHQGHQGATAAAGAQGAEGNFGGATFYYTFEANTTNANPGSGDLRLDNSTQNAATGIYICDTDEDGNDIASYLQTIDDSTSTIKGHVKITNKLDSSQFILFTISSLTDNTGYFDITVSPVDSSATSPFSANEDILITFARTGDKGETGAQGAQGAQGHQGHQGATAAAGAQGAQGHQGHQGAAGAQGAQGHQGHQGAGGSAGAQGNQGYQGAANATTINNNISDYILTGTGTANTINGEANLQMTGNILTFNTTANTHRIQNVATGDHYCVFEFDSNRSGSNQVLSFLDFQWNGTKVADIYAESGNDTTNKDDGNLVFRTSPAQGSITSRLRIQQNGVSIFGDNMTASTGDAICEFKKSATGGNQARIQIENTSNNSVNNQASVNLKTPTAGTATVSFYNQGEFYISCPYSSSYFMIYLGGSTALHINSSKHVLPGSNNAQDLGTSSTRWRNIYTNDLNLSNQGSTNSIDNTWGDYTIQEGESDLFLINNRNGKKYKFNLTEVS